MANEPAGSNALAIAVVASIVLASWIVNRIFVEDTPPPPLVWSEPSVPERAPATPQDSTQPISSIQTTSRTMPFEQCLQVIRNTGSQLGLAPINIVETNIARIVRFCGDDGSVLVACSLPDQKMVIIRNPRRPGCD